MNKKYVHWTTGKREIVRRMYLDECKSDQEIANHFKVPRHKIKNLIHRMGLKKNLNSGAFKSGNLTWNKGKVGVNGFSHTRFKPGNNAVADGEVRKQKTKEGERWYIYLNGKRELYHRYLYLQANPGFVGVVTFLDGNYLNCTLENLEGISRAENARRVIKTRKPRRAKPPHEAPRIMSIVYGLA